MHGGEEGTLPDLDFRLQTLGLPVSCGQRNRLLLHVGRNHSREPRFTSQRQGDGSRAGAHIEGRGALEGGFRQPRQHVLDQEFRLRSRNQDPRLHEQIQFPKRLPANDVLEGFPGRTPFQHRPEVVQLGTGQRPFELQVQL